MLVRLRTSYIILLIINLVNLTIVQAQTKPITAATDSSTQKVKSLLNRIKSPTDSIPTPTDTLASKNGLNQIVMYESNDSIYFSLSSQKAYLYKTAKIKSESITLDADYIQIDMKNNIVQASGMKDSLDAVNGRPIFKDGGQSFESDTIRYNIKTKEGIVKNVMSEQSGGYLHGGTTKIHPNKHIHVRNGMYTTCDAKHPHFYIRLSRAKVIPNDKIVSGLVNFVILDIPTPIGLPFGYFPNNVEKKSGILFPKYGENREKGFFLSEGGYYWAMSEYADLALVGSAFSRGSWDVRMKSQYKLKYKFNGSIDLHYARNVLGEEGLPNFVDKRSYSVQVRHTQDAKANPFSRFNVSVKYEGGLHRQLNSTNYNDYVNSNNSSSISYSYTPNEHWSMTLGGNANQNTRTQEVNITAPNLQLNVNRRYFFGNDKKSGKRKWYEKIQYQYSAQSKANIKGYDSTLISDQTKVQAGFSHTIPISASYKFLKFFTLSPSVGYKGVLYPYSIEKRWESKLNVDGESLRGIEVTDTIPEIKYGHSVSPSISLAFAPKIYGFFEFGKKAKVKAIRHLILPTASINLAPDGKKLNPGYFRTYTRTNTDGTESEVDYSIFEKGIYGGPGSSSEAGSVSLGLRNQFEMKVRNEGVDSTATDKERFKKVSLLNNFDFTSGYNILEDSIKWRDIAFNTSTDLFKKKLRVNLRSSFTMYQHSTENGRSIDQFRFNNGLSPLRHKNTNLTADITLDNNTFKKESNTDKKDDSTGSQPKAKTASSKPLIPWNVTISYSFNYTTRWDNTLKRFEPNTNQTLYFNGNLDITTKWKFGFRTGWDFERREVSATNFNFSRDLHCWQMSMNWIPFGTLKSYYFQINVKSSIFKDLKYELKETINRTSF